MILALYAAAVAADVLSTLYERRRGAGESHSLLRAVGRFWSSVRLVLAALIPVLFYAFDAPSLVLVVASVFYGAVAVSNVLVARSMP